MYGLTVIINGEHTRADAFASIIDAAEAYESVLQVAAGLQGVAEHTFPTNAYADALTLTRGGFTADTFEVHITDESGEVLYEIDRYTVTLQYVAADEIESDGWTFIPSSALPVLYGPERESEPVTA